MSDEFTCSEGHHWPAATGSPGACPVCGNAPVPSHWTSFETVELPRGPTPDPLHPSENGKTIPPDDEHATLPRPTPAAVPSSEFQSLPGYELLEPLSGGAFVRVYRARQTALNRVVAIKVMLPGTAQDPVQRRRFRIEAEAVARLQHPNIVQIFDIEEHGGALFFAMEYCPGGTLAGRLRDAVVPPRKAAQLVAALADAVHAAHHAGIVHRDLKPGNVLLTGDGTPKVADFGLVHLLEQPHLTATSNVVGTPSYMAPEQAGGRRVVGPAADVHALGAILYECLTGRPPFRGASAFDTIRLVLESAPPRPSSLRPGCPEELERICLKCLRKEPRQRYRSAREIADELRGYLRGAPRPPRFLDRVRQAARWLTGRPSPPRPKPPEGPDERLLGENRHLRAFLEASGDGLVIVDAAGRLVRYNPAAAALLGLGPADLGASGWAARFHCFGPDGTTPIADNDRPLNRALRGEAEEVAEVLLRSDARPDGVWLSLSARPLRDEVGAPEGAVLVCRDVGERRALRESQALYHSLVEGLPVNVFRKDREGRYTYANSLFCETMGLRREDVLGRRDHDLFEPDLADLYRADDQQILRRGDVVERIEEHVEGRCWPRCRCSVVGELADEAGLPPSLVGRKFVQSLLAPVRDARNNVVGTQGAFWNVTPRMRAERQLAETVEELRRANAELGRTNGELEQFAYVASHDLQEPLRMVVNFTQLLQKRYRGRLDPDADEFIGFAVDGARRMQGLINDLLTYSRVGTRGRPLEETSSSAAYEQAIANLRAAIEESGAQVTADALPVVRADPTQLVQLFQNLIGNGIKFRRSGPPIVQVRSRYHNGEWLFAVRDAGIGIDAEHVKRLFAPFVRLHTRDQYPGTGIGLAVCKKIVERHGGRIWVESQPGVGSTFYFTLRAEWPAAED